MEGISFEKIGFLTKEIFETVLILEENIEPERRLSPGTLEEFFKIPDCITCIARDKVSNGIVGYVFGIPQHYVRQTDTSNHRGRDINQTFYMTSWQVLPSYQRRGIGTALKSRFRNEVCSAGYSYLAFHQNDWLDREGLNFELAVKYKQGDTLYELARGLSPPPGTNIPQQYVVIKLSQDSHHLLPQSSNEYPTSYMP